MSKRDYRQRGVKISSAINGILDDVWLTLDVLNDDELDLFIKDLHALNESNCGFRLYRAKAFLLAVAGEVKGDRAHRRQYILTKRGL